MAKRFSTGQFTIFNYGTPHAFNPNKKIHDPWSNKETTLLNIHLAKVKEANDPLVYILDDSGYKLNTN